MKKQNTFVYNPEVEADNINTFNAHNELLNVIHAQPKHYENGVIYNRHKFAAELLCKFIHQVNPEIRLTVRPIG